MPKTTAIRIPRVRGYRAVRRESQHVRLLGGRSEVRPPPAAVDLQRPHTASQTVAMSFPTRRYAKQGRRSRSPSRGDRGFAWHMEKVGFPVGGKCASFPSVGWNNRWIARCGVIEGSADEFPGRSFMREIACDPRSGISLPTPASQAVGISSCSEKRAVLAPSPPWRWRRGAASSRGRLGRRNCSTMRPSSSR